MGCRRMCRRYMCRRMAYWRMCCRRTSDGDQGFRRGRSRCVQHGPPLRGSCRRFFRGALRAGCCFGVGNTLQVVPDFFCNFDRDGTGVGFLFGYAKPRKKVNDGLSFDLEFTGEFINADLGCVTHASLGTFLFLLFHRSLRFRGGSGRGGSLGGRFFGIGFRFGGGLRLGFGPGFGASFTGCFTWAC